MVTNPCGAKVVLELVAHETDAAVAEHIRRSRDKYARIPGVREVWVINFTTRKPGSKKGYVWHTDEEVNGVRVRVIHVWHDLGWTEAMISESADDVHCIKLRQE